MIRAFEPRDAPPAAALSFARDPYHAWTAAGLVHELTSLPARARFASFVAEEGGELLGWSSGNVRWQVGDDTVGDVYVVVREDAEGKGLGRSLADAAEEHLAAVGVESVRAFAYEGGRGERFAHARGYREARRELVQELDPTAVELPEPEHPTTPLTELRDRPRELYELFIAVESDMPTDLPWTGYSFDEWLAETWEDPRLDFETSVVAFVGEQVAAASWLVLGDDDYAEVEVTGTIPVFRRRGLARACKLDSMRRAAAKGIRRLSTDNDDDNEGMLALNRELGFQRVAVLLELTRELGRE